MNRTIRNLVIAVPLATVGLTMVNVAAATAGPNGPVIIIQPNGGDPEPKPDFPIKDAPKPKGPQDKAPLPKPKPKDKAPKPAVKPQPNTGVQVAAPKAAPKTDVATTTVASVEVISAHGSADSIDRSDVLFVSGPAETKLAADTTDDSMDLTWLLIGGGIITASGAAFAARKRSNA